MEVIAVKIIKGKVYRHKYTQSEWDLLGKDKNGWVETDSQKIDNTINALKATASGKDQIIDNTVKPDVKFELPVIDDKKLDVDDSKITIVKPVVDNEEQKREEFMNAIAGFNKGTIKDYFDGLEEPVKYDNKAKIEALQLQLGEYFKFDIVELQKAFS